MNLINRLYNPNGKELGALVSGLSGSGKTTAVISTLQQAIKSAEFGESHRFVIIDPKHQSGDYDILANPISNPSKARKSIRKNRVTVFYPSINNLESEVSSIIDYMFDLSLNSDVSFTFVLDEASALIYGTSIPDSLKRVAVQGRAKLIKPIFISQRPIMNRWTDANLSTALFFRILPVDSDVLKKRWGVNFEDMSNKLIEREYSYMIFDLEKADLTLMEPVPLPKVEIKKKKGVFAKLFNF
jgi:hypothetical protein